MLIGLGITLMAGLLRVGEVQAEPQTINHYEIQFDSEKVSKVTTAMIKKKLGKKYGVSSEGLSIQKNQPTIERKGTYDIQLSSNSFFFQKKKIETEVNFSDKTGPKLAQTSKTIAYGRPINDMELVKAQDKTDGLENANRIKIFGLNSNKLGPQTFTVKATDQAGNTTKQSFEAEVVDTVKPELMNVSDCSLSLTEAAKFQPMNGVIGKDNADGEITRSIQVSMKSIPAKPGIYTIVYTLKDSSGNEAKKMRKITVLDDSTQNEQEGTVEENNIHADMAIKNDTETANSPDPVTIPAQKVASTISFLGVTIPFSHTNGADSAPANGCGTWTGTGAVDDNAPTHFIGHNPGDFSKVMDITVGTPITVLDDQGHSKTYTVYEVLDVNDDGTNAHDSSDDTWQRVINDGGERISLQTCITDTVNRIVLAR